MFTNLKKKKCRNNDIYHNCDIFNIFLKTSVYLVFNLYVITKQPSEKKIITYYTL